MEKQRDDHPNRYGHTDAGRLVVQKTGVSSHNPFAQQQQQQSDERPFFDI
jgi:epsin